MKKKEYEEKLSDAAFDLLQTLWKFHTQMLVGPMNLIVKQKDAEKAEILYEVLDIYTQLYFKTRELATGATANVDPSWKSEGV